MEAFKLAQLGIAYGQSMLAFKTNGSPRPFSASFAVSNRCNIRCSYCNFPNKLKPELTLQEIDVIFNRLKKMGVKRLGLMGGEPLYRKDILDIIALGKTKGFSMSMNSNLLLYDKFKDNLEDIDYFFTSLDGTPEKHLKNRGSQNYDKILAAIRDIKNRGKKITAICVVTDPDYEGANYLLELAGREGIQIHFQAECFNAEYAITTDKVIDSEALGNFWAYLARQRQQGAPIASSVEYLKYISQWKDFSVTSFYDPNEKCGAGRGYLFVDASGNAFPCAYVTASFKSINLLENDWNEAFDKQTPCTKCIVGPMLEFNLLFDKPVSSLVSALNKI